MTTVPCPACHSDIIIDDSETLENDLVSCVNCGKDFEISSLAPLALRELEEVDESAV